MDSYEERAPQNESSGDAVNLDFCNELTDRELQFLDFSVFWIEGFALCVFALFGIIANIISVIILSKDDLRTFFSHLLIALSVFDGLYLFLSLVEAFRRSFHLATSTHIYLFAYILYPLHSLFMLVSIYMTIAIAVERYRAVLFPISLRLTLQTTKRMYRRRLSKYLSTVVLPAILITLPRFFELYVVPKKPKSNGNETALSFNPQIEPTDLRLDPNYTIYYVNLIRFVFTGAGPVALLAFFYYKIYVEIRGHNQLRHSGGGRRSSTQGSFSMGNLYAHRNARLQSNQSIEPPTSPTGCSGSMADESNRRRQEAGLAKLFIRILFAFLLCHLPRVIINLHEMIMIENVLKCYHHNLNPYSVWMHAGVCFSHLLLVANSSINIIFYLWHNRVFKEHFVKMFSCKKTRLREGEEEQNIAKRSPSANGNLEVHENAQQALLHVPDDEDISQGSLTLGNPANSEGNKRRRQMSKTTLNIATATTSANIGVIEFDDIAKVVSETKF